MEQGPSLFKGKKKDPPFSDLFALNFYVTRRFFELFSVFLVFDWIPAQKKKIYARTARVATSRCTYGVDCLSRRIGLYALRIRCHVFFLLLTTLDLGWISCCKAEYSNQLRTGGITISLTRSQTMVTGSRSTFRIHGLISNQRIWFVWFSRRKSVFFIPGWQLPVQDDGSRDTLGISHMGSTSWSTVPPMPPCWVAV